MVPEGIQSHDTEARRQVCRKVYITQHTDKIRHLHEGEGERTEERKRVRRERVRASIFAKAANLSLHDFREPSRSIQNWFRTLIVLLLWRPAEMIESLKNRSMGNATRRILGKYIMKRLRTTCLPPSLSSPHRSRRRAAGQS